MKKLLCLMLCLVLGTCMLTGCKGNEPEISVDEILKDTSMVVGTVEDQNIYAYEVIYYLKSGATIEQAQQVIEETKLFQKLAAENGITFNEDMQAQVDEFLSSSETQYGSAEKLESELKKFGVTKDQYVAMLKEAIITEAVVNKIVENGTIKEASDEEAKAYFDTNFLKAKHILLSTVGEDGQTALSDEEISAKTKTAEETLAAIKGGAPFEQFESLNEDPGSASAPEGYVFLNTDVVTDQSQLSIFQQAGISMMVPEFTTGTAALEIDAVSDLVQTAYGYHIIKRVALTDEDFESCKDVIKSALTQGVFTKYVEDELAKAAISWNESAVKTLSENIEPAEVDTTQAAQQ